ncbi:MAG: hypothetical protein M1834_007551 [Cirrosporium novae-zelandiae]|nr:MAG: hypothetical protein M1834_007551 [Cirrosporium novae-zelandiae]
MGFVRKTKKKAAGKAANGGRANAHGITRKTTISAKATGSKPGEREYQIAAIINSRVRDFVLEYRVKWKFSKPKYTWEPIQNLRNAPMSIEAFHEKQPLKPRRVPFFYRLFELPLELRDIIYHYYLFDGVHVNGEGRPVIVVTSSPSNEPKGHSYLSSILCVNRQVSDEAAKVFFGRAEFQFIFYLKSAPVTPMPDPPVGNCSIEGYYDVSSFLSKTQRHQSFAVGDFRDIYTFPGIMYNTRPSTRLQYPRGSSAAIRLCTEPLGKVRNIAYREIEEVITPVKIITSRHRMRFITLNLCWTHWSSHRPDPPVVATRCCLDISEICMLLSTIIWPFSYLAGLRSLKLNHIEKRLCPECKAIFDYKTRELSSNVFQSPIFKGAIGNLDSLYFGSQIKQKYIWLSYMAYTIELSRDRWVPRLGANVISE